MPWGSHLTAPNLVGINIGTSKLVAVSACPGQPPRVAEVALLQREPPAWIHAVGEALGQIGLDQRKFLVGICGTSGSFVLTDQYGAPVGRPVMYDETYPEAVAEVSLKLAGSNKWRGSDILEPDNAFLKLYHFWNELDNVNRDRVRWAIPQSVWITHSLAIPEGDPWTGITADISNCRKLGGRLADPQWPTDLCELLGLPASILPAIAPSGTACGEVRSAAGIRFGLGGSRLFHGTTDANAEALSLIGDNVGHVGVIAGSTSCIRGVLGKAEELPSAGGYIMAHPLNPHKYFYSACIAVGENLRLRAAAEGVPVPALIAAAWQLPDTNEIPDVPLRRTSVTTEWMRCDNALFARGVMESAAWWEASRIEAFSRAAGRMPEQVAMIGGTARSELWLQWRCNAYGSPVLLQSAAGALGAVLPGLLGNGFLPSYDEFRRNYAIPLRRVTPHPLSRSASSRRARARTWIEEEV